MSVVSAIAGERRALELEAAHELGGEMLAVRGRAAVAAGEHLAAALERRGERSAGTRDRFAEQWPGLVS